MQKASHSTEHLQELPKPSVAKALANLAETLALVSLPLLALDWLASRDPGAWRAAGMGLLAFLLAMVLGQYGLVRLVTNRLKIRSQVQGLEDRQDLATYLYPRLIPVGALVAGFFEETARLALLPLLPASGSASWLSAVAFGLGHGGTEAVLLGLAIGAVGLLDVLLPRKMAGLTLIGVRRFTAGEHWAGIADRAGVTLSHILLTLMVAHTGLTGRLAGYMTAVLLHAAMDFVGGTASLRLGWSPARLSLVGWATAAVCGLVLWGTGWWAVLQAPR